MKINHKTEIEYGDNCFSLTGTQINAAELVKMTCKFRNDGEPTIFIFRGKRIAATIDNIIQEDERGLTTIGDGDISIRQVEHVLSAFYGMGCHDSDIELNYVNSAIQDTIISPPVAYLDSKEFALAQ